ncbi:MAG: DUF3801 domain-containing protein [Ruminococcus sp.]|nr:DUF3801 domain-containing protein [Ruminococcus sp.]
MHGDDVASAGVEVTTQIVSKATEIFMEMLKITIEREREKNRLSEKSEVLSGRQMFSTKTTYQQLKEGGEITMLPSFAKEDYRQLLRQAKKMDIPVAAVREQGKDNTISVFINVQDKEAVNSIVQGIVREKMKAPEQTQRMITIEKEQIEGFQTYCSEHDIPVNFMETSSDVKCIFNSAYEKQIEAAVENYRRVQSELSKTEIKVQNDERGRPKIIVNDFENTKKLTVNFCTKAKLERILRERLDFDNVKSIEAANALVQRLSEEQRKYFLSGSRSLAQMEFYQKDIKFENENVLTDRFSFAKIKLPNEDFSRLTITDQSGNFAVLSEKNTDREQVEKSIRAHLRLDDTETVKAVLEKAERLGFAEKPRLTQFKEYQIERETQTAFTVRGGNTVVRLDLSDRETAKKQLVDSFGMSSAKAEKIISKAMKQSVKKNLLKKAREKISDSANTLRHKKIERGSRK